jgi:hypothetical protein
MAAGVPRIAKYGVCSALSTSRMVQVPDFLGILRCAARLNGLASATRPTLMLFAATTSLGDEVFWLFGRRLV